MRQRCQQKQIAAFLRERVANENPQRMRSVSSDEIPCSMHSLVEVNREGSKESLMVLKQVDECSVKLMSSSRDESSLI